MYDFDDDLDYEIPFTAATDAMAIVEITGSQWLVRAVNESFERAFDRPESEIRGTCLKASLDVEGDWPFHPHIAAGSVIEGYVDIPDRAGESFVRISPFETDSARSRRLVTITDSPGAGGQPAETDRDGATEVPLRPVAQIARADDVQAACDAGARLMAEAVDFDAFVVDLDDQESHLTGVEQPIQLPRRDDRTAAFLGADIHDSNNERTWGAVMQFPVADRGRLQLAAGSELSDDLHVRWRVEQFGQYLGAVIGLLAHKRALAAERDELSVFNRILRHDVLNGLNLIWARLDLLKGDISVENRDHFETVTERVDDMIDRVEAVRAIRKDNATTDTTARPLAPIVRAAIDRASGQHPDISFSIVGSVPDLTVAVDDRIEFCLRNVLHMSAQYADIETPAVRVAVDRIDGHAAVRVADNGPGVPDDIDQPVLTMGAHPDEGDGHGLFLTERVVEEIYDGIIRADEREEGAEYVIELPLASA